MAETFPGAEPGATLPDKEPGVHRWVVIASFTVSAEEAAAAVMGVPVTMDAAHLFTPTEIGCLDCEKPYGQCWTEPCPAGDDWAPLVDTGTGMDQADKDALLAGVDMIGRTGATDFEVGHTGDEESSDITRQVTVSWWAAAKYRGARVTVEHHHSPVAAVEALVRRLLSGGTCTHCGRKVRLGGVGGNACRYHREGRAWIRGCADTHP
jgi:hypothetical protein